MNTPTPTAQSTATASPIPKSLRPKSQRSRFLRRPSQPNLGYSALELVVVLGLFSALIKLSIPNIKEFQQRSANREAKSIYTAIRTELETKNRIALTDPLSLTQTPAMFFNQKTGSLAAPLSDINLPSGVKVNYVINLPKEAQGVVAFEVEPINGNNLFRYTSIHGKILEQVVKK